jgi:hypothetical protein
VDSAKSRSVLQSVSKELKFILLQCMSETHISDRNVFFKFTLLWRPSSRAVDNFFLSYSNDIIF